MNNQDMWEELKLSCRPVFMYGTGNGSDKLLSVMSGKDLHIDGVFASDGFVRDRSFAGMKVRSYSDVISEHGDDINIILAFGSSLPDVMSFIAELDRRHNLYIPELPLYGGVLPDKVWYRDNADRLESVKNLLADDYSKCLFEDAVAFRLSGKLKYLQRTEPFADSLKYLFTKHYVRAVDGGAFKGDSTALISSLDVDNVIAAEPDPRTFAKLTEYAVNETGAQIEAVNAALSAQNGEVIISSSGSRGSGQSGKNHRSKETVVKTVTIDSLAGDRPVNLIKLDVEGDENAAVDGAVNTIKTYHPDMAVSLYHKTDDIIELTEKIHSLMPEKKLYLRRPPCIPMWDLCLYAN